MYLPKFNMSERKFFRSKQLLRKSIYPTYPFAAITEYQKHLMMRNSGKIIINGFTSVCASSQRYKTVCKSPGISELVRGFANLCEAVRGGAERFRMERSSSQRYKSVCRSPGFSESADIRLTGTFILQKTKVNIFPSQWAKMFGGFHS